MAGIQLCTLDQVKLQLGILDTSSDALLQQLIDGVNAEILNEICRPDLMPQLSYTDFFCAGIPPQKLYLKHYPIVEIDAFTINGADLPAWDPDNPDVQGYYLDPTDRNPENYQFVQLVGFPADYCYGYWAVPWLSWPYASIPVTPNIRVDYKAGYNSVPLALQQAAIEFVGFKRGLSQIQAINPAVAQRRMGDYEESLGSGRLVMDFLGMGIPQTVLDVISQYKRIVV